MPIQWVQICLPSTLKAPVRSMLMRSLTADNMVKQIQLFYILKTSLLIVVGYLKYTTQQDIDSSLPYFPSGEWVSEGSFFLYLMDCLFCQCLVYFNVCRPIVMTLWRGVFRQIMHLTASVTGVSLRFHTSLVRGTLYIGNAMGII